MTDIKRVIKGFEQCLICGIAEDKCAECPYIQDTNCIVQLKRDALELLKEYEVLKDENARLIQQKKELTQRITQLQEEKAYSSGIIYDP